MSDLDAIGEVDVLTAELIDTARACRPGKGEAKRYVFLTRDGKKQGEAVRIGKRLYGLGGTTVMLGTRTMRSSSTWPGVESGSGWLSKWSLLRAEIVDQYIPCDMPPCAYTPGGLKKVGRGSPNYRQEGTYDSSVGQSAMHGWPSDGVSS